jgi:sodium transport system permease protein
MRPRIVWTIFQKEITEALRDRVTLLVLVGLPFVAYPLTMLLTVKVIEHQAFVEDRRVSSIAMWGVGAATLVDWLAPTNNRLKLERWQGIPASLRSELEAGRLQPPARTNPPSAPPELRLGLGHIEPTSDTEPDDAVITAARAVVSSKQVDAVLIVWPGFDDALQQQALGRVSVYYDSVIPNSALAWSRLSDQLGKFRRQLVKDRQRARGLPEGFVTALEVREDNIAPVQRQLGDAVGRLLPLVLIMLSVIGSMMAAVDMTAGEKDRATMQTLLCAPVRSLEIVGGKFLAVWTVGFLSAAVNVACFGFISWRMTALAHIHLVPFGTLAAVIVLLVPATWTIAALFMAVAAIARDAKDAGNFLAATLLLVLFPVGATLLPGVELNSWTCFAPLANLSLLIRALLVGEVAGHLIFLTLLSSLAYAGLALALAARVFGREQILLGGPLSWRGLLRGDPGRATAPTPALVLTFFALVLVGFFYVGLSLIEHSLVTMLLVTEFGVLLSPAVGLAVVRKFPLAQTFSLRRPHWRSLLGSTLIGLAASLAVSGLVSRIVTAPDEWQREFIKTLQLGDQSPQLWKLWLVLALTPAVCEETFFRGLMLSGLRRWGPWAAIGISALLFGLVHGSLYRLLPTFILGLLLGYAVWRSGSLYCSVLIHTLNNGLIATLVWSARGKTLAAESAPWSLTLGAVVVTGVGLALLTGPKASKDSGALNTQDPPC